MTYRIGLFGAAPDTPNMGVSALYSSTVSGISQVLKDVEWVVFDNNLGLRKTSYQLTDGISVPMTYYGVRLGLRLYRNEHLYNMLYSSLMGRTGRKLNQGVKLIDSCDAVLDLSGGDSFSDIYGKRRFRFVAIPKWITLNRGVPLILLPQTYGPYIERNVKQEAKDLIARSTCAWARDENSYAVLSELLGNEFDTAQHRCGVDMAFGLEAIKPSNPEYKSMLDWISSIKQGGVLIGINVSGLIYNNIKESFSRYKFKVNYREVMSKLLNELLKSPEVGILLISHVMDIPGHFESDEQACKDLQQSLIEYKDRVVVSQATLNESEVKWIIGQCDWFCGTRMHSTIAALSSFVPTATISYSDKAQGVFDTCGQRSEVYDPRVLDDSQIVSEVYASYCRRGDTKDNLIKNVTKLKCRLAEQYKDISESIKLASKARK